VEPVARNLCLLPMELAILLHHKKREEQVAKWIPCFPSVFLANGGIVRLIRKTNRREGINARISDVSRRPKKLSRYSLTIRNYVIYSAFDILGYYVRRKQK
jgi:hypothetical protein